MAVADEEILAMTRQISSSEGILVEPTAAVSLTAVRKASQSGVVKGTVINVVTGTGLKTLSLFASLWGMGAKAEELPASEFAELTEESAKSGDGAGSAPLGTVYQRLCADFSSVGA